MPRSLPSAAVQVVSRGQGMLSTRPPEHVQSAPRLESTRPQYVPLSMCREAPWPATLACAIGAGVECANASLGGGEEREDPIFSLRSALILWQKGAFSCPSMQKSGQLPASQNLSHESIVPQPTCYPTSPLTYLNYEHEDKGALKHI